jgi:hypothetical protein
MYKDIKWEYRPPNMQNNMAYIPWSRVADFITGEQDHRMDV